MAGQAPRQGDANDPFADTSEEDRSRQSDESRSRDAAQGGTGSDPHGSSDDGEDEVTRLRNNIRELRRSNTSLKRDLDTYKPKAGQAEDAEARAVALQRERDEANRQLREERATRQIMAAASKAGAVDPEDVADLVLRRDLVEFDTDGRATDVSSVIRELQQNKPHLFTTKRVPEADAGRGNGRSGEGGQQSDWNAAFRRKASESSGGR